MIPRRHSPTDGGNRSNGGRELAEEIRDTALGIVLVPGSRYVGELVGAAGAVIAGIKPVNHPRWVEADQLAHADGWHALSAESWNLALGTSEEFCQNFRRPKWSDGGGIVNFGVGHCPSIGVNQRAGNDVSRSGNPEFPGQRFQSAGGFK